MSTTMKSFLVGTLWFSSFLLSVQGEEIVDLLTAGNYAILSKAGITNVPESVITGDMAVSPIAATSITGFALSLDSDSKFSTSDQVLGDVFAADYAAPTPSILSSAVTHMEAAYTEAAGRTAGEGARLNLGGGTLGGEFGGSGSPLTPGVYTFTTDVTITNAITFQGSDTDIFIIQVAGYMTLATNIEVTLTGGAKPENIFWQVSGYVTLFTGAHMEGIILCATNVNMQTGSSLDGRILAQTAVALDIVTIVEPTVTTSVVVAEEGAPTAAPAGTAAPTSLEDCTSAGPSRIRRLQGTQLYERWDIANPIFRYETLGFELDFKINEFVSSVDQVTYRLFDATCDNAYTGNGLSGSKGSEFFDPGDGKHSIQIATQIDANTIRADTQVYSEDVVGADTAATIDFCVRFSLYTAPAFGDLEVNYLEIVVQLDVDLTAGFEIGALSVAPLDRCVNEATQEFFLEGYFCEEGKEADPTGVAPVYNQGSLVKICVRPVANAREAFFVRMLRITSFAFERDLIVQPAIVAGAVSGSGLTDLHCLPGYAICHFETILFAAFYASPGAVTGSGIADMQFGGDSSPTSLSPKNRRALRENRSLQDGAADAGVASAMFELAVEIVPVDTKSAASSSRGLFAMAVAVAAGAMLVL